MRAVSDARRAADNLLNPTRPAAGPRQAATRRTPSSAPAGEGPATVDEFLAPARRALGLCPRCGGTLELVADGSINLRPAPFVSCASCEFCEEVVR